MTCPPLDRNIKTVMNDKQKANLHKQLLEFFDQMQERHLKLAEDLNELYHMTSKFVTTMLDTLLEEERKQELADFFHQHEQRLKCLEEGKILEELEENC